MCGGCPASLPGTDRGSAALRVGVNSFLEFASPDAAIVRTNLPICPLFLGEHQAPQNPLAEHAQYASALELWQRSSSIVRTNPLSPTTRIEEDCSSLLEFWSAHRAAFRGSLIVINQYRSRNLALEILLLIAETRYSKTVSRANMPPAYDSRRWPDGGPAAL